MDFQLNDEQRQLADSLERVLTEQYDFERRRAIVAEGGSDAVWRTFGELGLFAILAALVGGGFKNIKLSDYKGKWIVICFYPGDFTFV